MNGSCRDRQKWVGRGAKRFGVEKPIHFALRGAFVHRTGRSILQSIIMTASAKRWEVGLEHALLCSPTRENATIQVASKVGTISSLRPKMLKENGKAKCPR
ncbi:hypothetical protein Poly41_46950 [Novipirellula artificiosorum]|uniref:Uncharacterized protein n=1 Tax=Novipirellula artificiosorum TaxID=2528016 RepID=A0A5C6DFG5_9BACT|nr:hypothetical protein Poly41_46950 [Novipirellula artificiosorum]